MFDIQQEGDVIIIVPQHDLREFEFGQIEAEGAEVLDILEQSRAKNAIFDFYKTDYYGSTALSFFVKVWKRVRANGGSMFFCNVSEHELEILELTKLGELWGLCGSREEALKAVK
jgi:anti-anti-sigma factor